MPTSAAPLPTDHPRLLTALDTPCLLLDEEKVRANVERLRARLRGAGVALRPHLKTAKSIDVARLAWGAATGAGTVSTLKEAEYFADHGVTDLIYAVGIAPSKLARVQALRGRGVDLMVVLDSVEAARAVAEASRAAGASGAIPALIEIDCDGHRSGVQPHEVERLLAIGRALRGDGSARSANEGAELRGILTHAGESYNCRGEAALRAMAEQERAAAVRCATVLRDAGLPCPIVSIGSTPTAEMTGALDGVTEVRAGVFMFFDLVMAGIGVCRPEDVAVSVLATVIGHQRAKGWIITDAGWMALSRDRGTSRWSGAATATTTATPGDAASAPFARDQGYGLVCDLDGRPYPDLIVKDANQEHGILALRPCSDNAASDAASHAGGGATLPDLPLGTLVRILPNHACATSAQHDRYHVLAPGAPAIRAEWPRINGW